MQNINFAPIDYSFLRNEQQNAQNQMSQGMGQLASAGSQFDSWYDAKKKWDNMLEEQEYQRAKDRRIQDEEDRRKKVIEGQQAYFNQQRDNAVAGKKAYDDAILKQQKLQQQIENANAGNALQSEWNELYKKSTGDRFVDAGGNLVNGQWKNGGYVVEGDNGSYTNYGDNPENYGLKKVSGLTDEEQERMKSIGLEEAYKYRGTDVGELQKQLAEQQRIAEQNRQYAANADMYDDPRFKAAVDQMSIDGNANAVNSFINQWNAEQEQQRQIEIYNQSVEGMRQGQQYIIDNYDLEEMDDGATLILKSALASTNPQDYNNWVQLFNSYVASAAERERLNNEQFNANRENALLNLKNDEVRIATTKDNNQKKSLEGVFENAKAQFEKTYGQYISSDNAGLNAIMAAKPLVVRKKRTLQPASAYRVR